MILVSADKHVRVFNYRGKLGHSFQASNDILRALCRVPLAHGSGADIATAGNDKSIRLWTIQGKLVGELIGHENFVYSLTSLTSGELVSCGEDRTVKIWKGLECVQTIPHPAISVWCVATSPTGDIATGTSDNVVRIFTRDPKRLADEATLKEHDEAVENSLVPQQALDAGSRSDYPGPEFIKQKSGTKDGQTQVIKEANGKLVVYQWTTQSNTWIKFGEVVDSEGNSAKVNYNGKDYDYVFDVDIKDGEPALKLPYNVTESPWQASYDFLAANELPQSYLEEVANFITRNTQGTSLGTRPSDLASGSAEPWGTESRYRPGDSQQTQAPPPVKKVLPQTEYLSIVTANHDMMLKKIKEFNKHLIAEGDPSAFTTAEETSIEKTIKDIKIAIIKKAPVTVAAQTIEATLRGATAWPVEKRLPCLDFLRLLTVISPDTVKHFGFDSKTNLVARLAAAGVFDSGENGQPENNVMLAVRTLANLFVSEEGKRLADEEFERAMDMVAPYASSANKNLCIALTTLYINYAVLLTSTSAQAAETEGNEATSTVDRVITLLDALCKVLMSSTDPEALYRALVAAGTVVSLGKDYADVVKETMDGDVAIERAEKVGAQERIKEVVKEIKEGL
jgi:phospholipase A-2-activating protein